MSSENVNKQSIFSFPSLDLLNPVEKVNHRQFDTDVREQCRKLEQTLADFRVSAKVIGVTRGPSVTRYELEPAPGVKVSSIVNLKNEIAFRLAAPGIRVEAPIPGKAAIGIEVPNKINDIVSFREIVDCEDVRKNPSKLCVGLGKDIEGRVIPIDLAKMPNLLVAGAARSGRTVWLNTLLAGILYKACPDEVKLILVDCKVEALSDYNGIPHLLTPVITDAQKAASALHWTVGEMERRYKSFADTSVLDIKAYNAQAEEKMPYIVIVIDEVSDLMMVAKADVEDAILRLAQKARACGIHMVLATQRPSVDVITGILKANIPSRIAFAVNQVKDSRTIIDMDGAEKLLGKGDMLYYPIGASKPLRVKGSFISNEERNRVLGFVKQQKLPVVYNNEVTNTVLPFGNRKNEREILQTEIKINPSALSSALPVCLGKDKNSNEVTIDFSATNLLIAGSDTIETTSCIDMLLFGIITKAKPDEVKLIVIDGSDDGVLTKYNGIPHLLRPVVTDTEMALSALRWVTTEDYHRGIIFSLSGGERTTFNEHAFFKMPLIVVIVNEFEKLIKTAKADVEHAICRLICNNSYNAVLKNGISLVMATSKTANDVLTANVRKYFTGWLLCHCDPSKKDLLYGFWPIYNMKELTGNGDMVFYKRFTDYYAAYTMTELVQLQGCFINKDDLLRVINSVKDKTYKMPVTVDTDCERNNYFWTESEKTDVLDYGLLTAEQLYREAYSYRIGVHNHEKAFELYQKAAAMGMDKALFNLAECYFCGHGVNKDYEKGLRYSIDAARKNIPEDLTMHLLEERCLKKEYYGERANRLKAIELIQECSEQGNSVCMVVLGDIYCRRSVYCNIDKDYKKGIELYYKAAAQGNGFAESRLGDLYYNGDCEVTQDLQEALKWYQRAAGKEGFWHCKEMVGDGYYYGKGVEKDYGKAFEWYSKAEDGDAFWYGDVLCKLADMYRCGRGVEINSLKALELYRKVIVAGGPVSGEAYYQMAIMYENGEGVTQDLKEAGYLYKKAYHKLVFYIPLQLYHKGLLQYFGKGVKEDKEWAYDDIKEAADKGIEEAKKFLEEHYKDKPGCPGQ